MRRKGLPKQITPIYRTRGYLCIFMMISFLITDILYLLVFSMSKTKHSCMMYHIIGLVSLVTGKCCMYSIWMLMFKEAFGASNIMSDHQRKIKCLVYTVYVLFIGPYTTFIWMTTLVIPNTDE